MAAPFGILAKVAPSCTRLKLPMFCRFNCNRASIGKIGRAIYTRKYPTVLVQPDGSSYVIRHHEPRKIIKLPLDLTTLTPEQLRLRILKRKPKEESVVKEAIDVTFDPMKYLKMRKK